MPWIKISFGSRGSCEVVWPGFSGCKMPGKNEAMGKALDCKFGEERNEAI
jgi:hypothetical protein